MVNKKKFPLVGLPSVLGSAKPTLYEGLLIRAREMRDDPTNAEELLWERLKHKQLGVKFRRQHIVDKFIVDFCSIKSALIIEVDGNIHDGQVDADAERTMILEERGYRVIRFKNEEIFDDIERVIGVILMNIY